MNQSLAEPRSPSCHQPALCTSTRAGRESLSLKFVNYLFGAPCSDGTVSCFRHVIEYLVERWQFDYNSIFLSERKETKPRYTRLARKKRAAIETEKHVNGTRVKRQVSDGRTTTLCPTTPRFIMPRAALNSKGNWMYVVNLDTDQRYTQLVRSETCISSQCNGICSLPNGYTSRCEQQFVQKRLVALDGSGDNLYTDIFWLPHCCICQITQVNL
ncbi:unnamed protein product [Nesidiocoris tenuis]|uniref:Spaetzle domain-containing protein n=1 Tax=Nesidiocoris tenuis TaxID=355587 RepID=A0A6H5HUI8_9HEMI|nr:unnamed protein product [Nesidiocoris tenuis]